MTHHINTDHTVAVASDVFWIPIKENHPPHGVKLQLLGAGGVAVYSTYHGGDFWTHGAPLPKIPKEKP